MEIKLRYISKIFKAINDPKWAFERLKIKHKIKIFHKQNYKTHKAFLTQIFNNDIQDFSLIINEIVNDKEFNDSVNREFESAGLSNRFPSTKYSWPIFLYYFIRKTKPAFIVETGCWYGCSTSYILAAINKNNFGKLYTIDFPAYPEKGGYRDENPYLSEKERTASLPYGKEPGFIVPNYLRNSWELILGTTKEELPGLLNKLGEINMFLHDSLHSYENMIFEFDIAWKYLRKAGYIFSDNIDWNNAFKDFAGKNHKKTTYLAYYESPQLKHNFGAILKE